LFHATHDARFAESARYWLERTLQLRSPANGIAGFRSYLPFPGNGADPTSSWIPDAGFLMGATGIGLAAIAAIDTVEPAWDRTLLCSIPCRER
jgi:hypothetical protein